MPTPSLRWVRVALAAVLLQASPAWADDDSAIVTADEAVALALASNPNVRAADAQVLNARASRSSSAILLRNPQASAWVSTDGRRATYSASQPLSLTGESWFARSAAKQGLRGAEANLERTRRKVAAATRQAYINAAVATGTVEVAVEGAALAERLYYAISRKNEEGEASELELRMAHLAQAQAAVRLMNTRKQQTMALRSLASWTLQAADIDSVVADPEAAVPEASAPSDAERSDVVAARRNLAAARAQLTRQRARALPPLSVGIASNVEDSENFVGPQVGITVPLFNRNQSGRAASRGAVAVAEGRLEQAIASATTQQSTARARVAEAEALTEALGGDLASEAREALASIEAGVLAGEIELSTAVLLQAQVLNGETATVNMRGLVASARIDLLLATDDDALLGGAQ